MKYLLIMHTNPVIWDSLSEEEKNGVMEGHGPFMDAIKASGEMISTAALQAPSESATVRVRGGVPVVTDGPYLEAKEYLAGYYLVECASKERAYELAAMIPDASIEGLGVEVRPIIFSEGVGG
ncbi:YciI family protein [Amycolatopsis sp.]|jgi:hypothetical protein|uniref:YciI family protein n=1 Tax=Amycolatopsis sp. TaxID=37632 RepID=UPI002DFD9BE4|nr:YciI family protein [Amycolatopsis sp.]